MKFVINSIIIAPYNMKILLLLYLYAVAQSVQFSVSGISSGASFAHQLHVAYSGSVIGAGIISGDIYYCSLGSYVRWSTACACNDFLIEVSQHIQYANESSSTGDIDDTNNLKSSKVYIFSGILDSLITQPVVNKMVEFYEYFQANLITVFNFSAQHAWITDNALNPCWYLGIPYINNCGYDAAGMILNHIYPNLNPRQPQVLENLKAFSQTNYTDVWQAGLSNTGWIYIPQACINNPCNLHFAFHGCLMYYDNIGKQFIQLSGLNEWAEANSIIIIYPQTRAQSNNPAGCWDVYGYTGGDFGLKSSMQMAAIYKMAIKVPLVNWS
jgi:hypothetical protein